MKVMLSLLACWVSFQALAEVPRQNCLINGHPASGVIETSEKSALNGEFQPATLRINVANPQNQQDVITRNFTFLIKKQDASIPQLNKQVLYAPYSFATQSVVQDTVKVELDRVSGTETNQIEVRLDTEMKKVKSVQIRQRMLDSILAKMLPISVNNVSCDFSEL